MPRKAGSKTRTGWERSKSRGLLNQQRLLLRQSATSADLINQQRAAGLFVLVRVRLFVWLSVSEFLLDAHSDIPIPEEAWEVHGGPEDAPLERIYRKGLTWSSSLERS